MFLIWFERFLGLCVTKSQQQAQTLLAEGIINFDQAATSPRITAATVAECLETIMSLHIPIFGGSACCSQRIFSFSKKILPPVSHQKESDREETNYNSHRRGLWMNINKRSIYLIFIKACLLMVVEVAEFNSQN